MEETGTTDRPTVRHRHRPKPELSIFKDQGTTPPEAPLPPQPVRKVTARFIIVWTARILLPIVYLIASAKPVVIPSNNNQSTATSVGNIADSSVVLVITHSRDTYLQRCLDSLLRYHPGEHPLKWPLIVSRDEQDGEHPSLDEPLRKSTQTAHERSVSLVQWRHNLTYPRTPFPETAEPDKLRYINLEAYARISRHYKWALTRAFALDGVHQVVVVEDDLEVAADFYMYFEALGPMLHTDPSLFCVSAWNDNGVSTLSLNATQLHRTDFFPGLGWMVTRDVFQNELAPRWPAYFWDDWVRQRAQMRGRHCIRPEVSRTANFGRVGVSQSFHYDKHVSKVVLASTTVDFRQQDLSYLEEQAYFHAFFTRLSQATRLKYSNYLSSKPIDSDVIAFYPSGHLEAIAKRTGIMADHRDGVRRTSYHGVITFPWRGHHAFVVEKGWEPPEPYTLGSGECC